MNAQPSSELSLNIVDLAATRALAQAIAANLQVPLTIALSGTLGAGKTQLVRFLAESLGVAAEEITSPTYVLAQRYAARVTIYHLDFYRLKSLEEAWQIGIEEWLDAPVLTIIEWAEKFPECWPDHVLHCTLSQNEDGSRTAMLRAYGPRANAIFTALATK